MGIGVLASRWTRRQRPVEGSVLSGGEILLAVSGYLILSVIILVVQLVEPVHDLLSAVSLQVEFPEVQTRLGYTTLAGPGRTLNLLSHAGALLLYGSVGAYFVYRHAGRYSPGTAGRILSTTVQRMTSSSLGIASMVAMAVIMAHAGMTDVLARGLSEGVGRAFPLISPWIGALGAFMTGSNTNSNVVFSMLQLRTAELLGLGAPLVLAAQTAGGAIGSVIAPTKIIVGASTAEMAGKEGLILRSLLPPILSVLALVSLVVWGLISLGGG